MTPVQKQQNPISKHRYFQAPKGFFGYFKINLQVVKIHPPVTSLGKFVKIFQLRCNSLTPILVTATSQWTEQLAGNAAADRLLGKGHITDGVCYAAILQEIQTQCVSADLAVPAEATGLSTSTSLVMQNVPLS